MTELSINFTFVYLRPDEDDPPLSEEIMFSIRRKLAHILEDNGFGEIIHYDDGHFANEHLRPASDDYIVDDQALFISFNLNLPVEYGNLGGFLSEGVQELYNFISSFNNISLSILVSYRRRREEIFN